MNNYFKKIKQYNQYNVLLYIISQYRCGYCNTNSETNCSLCNNTDVNKLADLLFENYSRFIHLKKIIGIKKIYDKDEY